MKDRKTKNVFTSTISNRYTFKNFNSFNYFSGEEETEKNEKTKN